MLLNQSYRCIDSSYGDSTLGPIAASFRAFEKIEYVNVRSFKIFMFYSFSIDALNIDWNYMRHRNAKKNTIVAQTRKITELFVFKKICLKIEKEEKFLEMERIE